MELSISEDAETVSATVLGADLKAGQRPQGVVPKDAWQAARYALWCIQCVVIVPYFCCRATSLTSVLLMVIRSLGKWTLVSCTVAPAFEFSGFTLAPPEWAPGKPLA